MITLVRAIQTCIACPSQWDAWDADGNYYYLRYRHGRGEMRQYKSSEWVGAPWTDEVDKSAAGWAVLANTEYIRTIGTFDTGDPWDGVMDLYDFAKHLNIGIAPDIMYGNFGDYLQGELIMRGVLDPRLLMEHPDHDRRGNAGDRDPQD